MKIVERPVLFGSLAAIVVVGVTLLALELPLAAVGLVGGALFMWLAIGPGRGLYLLFTFLFFVPVTIDIGLPLDPLSVVFIPVAVIALIGGVRRALEGKQASAKLGALWAVYLFMGIAAIVGWPGLDRLSVVVRPYVVLGLVIWHVVAETRRSPGLMTKVLRYVMWVSIPIAILAIYQRFSGTWPVLDDFAIKSYRSFAGQNRSAGWMGHPIIYATFCMAMMLLAVARKPSKWQLFFIANLVGLILTGARSAWLAVAIALIFYWFSTRGRISGRWIAAFYATVVGVGIAALLAPSVIGSAISGVFVRLTDDRALFTAQARGTRADAAFDSIGSSVQYVLFGKGPGAANSFFSGTGVRDGLAQAFDNSYVLLWHDYGLLTTGAMVVALIIGISRGAIAGRVLLLGFAVQIFLFDFYGWPTAIGVLVLALAFRIPEKMGPVTLIPIGTTKSLVRSSRS